MHAFARLHCPLPRRLNISHRFLCAARLTHQPVPPSIASKKKFVVLSDLHVKRETLHTCLQALQFAHDLALGRDAAVLFLGDFWHARGNLPVEPLNAVLTHLESWKVPLLMIPGNHDLVSRSGNSVSLVPLATTLKDNGMLITKPTLCLDALFIPYMHDITALKAVLQEASVLPGKLRAVFCHVEVAGARLADRFISPQSPGSLNPTDFPPSLRVYSGHIHRPHTVSETIRYVGSPYQVSASEQGQDKSLLVLDRTIGWQVVDSVPIDIGPRHFTVCLDTPYTLPQLRRGDRVTLQTSTDHADIVNKLSEQGIRVQVQPMSNGFPSSTTQDGPFAPAVPRITTGALSSTDLFRKYSTIKSLGRAVTSAGIDILQEVAGRASVISGKDVVIQWCDVTMRGFGTFLEPITYPLSNRGVVLITGRDCDDDGIMTGRTNATGKTTLVMSALWAMTGRTDPRPDGSVEKGVSLEMVHDNAKECEVAVRMKLGGERIISEAFDMMSPEERAQAQIVDPNSARSNKFLNVVVSRTSTRNGTVAKTRSYKQHLCLEMNGIDVSCMDVKETQNRIDRLVDGTLLPHTVFFGQHMGAGRGLLDSTDRMLKDHLSLIFPLDIWKEARRRGRAKLLKLQELQITSEAALEAARSVVTRLEAAEALSRQQWALFEAERSRKITNLNRSLEDMIASSSRWAEDSVAFAESFVINTCSHDLTLIIQDLKRYTQTLDNQGGTNLDIARASAAAEIARTETLLQSDKLLHTRVSSLMKKAIEWEQSRENRLAEIRHYVSDLRDELEKMKSSAAIDASWKEAVGALKACDERLQELVGVNIRQGEGTWPARFANQCLRIESARKKAANAQEEKVKLATSLHEIRNRLIQSEEFSLFNAGSLKDELTVVSKVSSIVTCEKCLRPFDGVLFEEARSKLEAEAQSIEAKILAVDQQKQIDMTEYEEAVKVLNDEVEAQKAMILQEKQRITQSLGIIRGLRDHRTALTNDMSLYSAKAEKLQKEENLYISELLSFGIVNQRPSKDISDVLKKITEEIERRFSKSVEALKKANREYEHIISEIEIRERDRWDSHCEKSITRQHIEDLQSLQAKLKLIESERDSIREETNPYEESLRMLAEELSRESAIVQKRENEFKQFSDDIAVMKVVDVAFGPRGVPSFILEEGLTRLEKLTGEYLRELSAGELMLQLRGFSDYKSSTRVDGENKEVISKRIFVRKQHRTEVRERTLRQLSGGQRRRCSLSFALAFAALAHERAGFQSSLMVLDELLQSLDEDGRARIAKIIPGLLSEHGGTRDSVFVVAQDEAAEISGRAYGGVDVVERKLDRSTVLLDGKRKE